MAGGMATGSCPGLEQASPRGAPNRLDQEADVVLVDTGDGVAEADVRLVGEAGS